MADPTKFVSGVLCSLSAMVQMELPHINVCLLDVFDAAAHQIIVQVLTKCDLVDKEELDKYNNILFCPATYRNNLCVDF